MKTRDLAIAFAAGLLLGTFGYKIRSDNQIDRLQEYSDSVTVVANVRDEAMAELEAIIDTQRVALGKRQTEYVRVAVADGRVVARLDTALAEAQTVRDSNTVLLEQNEALRSTVGTLWQALAVSDSLGRLERGRGDSLAVMLTQANMDIRVLNDRIQDLDSRLPKWARYSIEAVKLGTAFWAGMEFQKAK